MAYHNVSLFLTYITCNHGQAVPLFPIILLLRFRSAEWPLSGTSLVAWQEEWRTWWIMCFLLPSAEKKTELIIFPSLSVQFSSCTQSCLTLRPHEPQHARPPCPLPTPGVHANPCPLSPWCHPTISSSVIAFFLMPSIFPSIRIFSSESVLCIRWPKYWSFSFSINPSNDYSGLISFRTDFLYSPSIDCLLSILNLMAPQVKNPPAMQESQETQVPSLG